MEDIEAREYVTLKALSEKIISGVSPAIAKVTKVIEKFVTEIDMLEKQLENSVDIKEINKLSKQSQEKRDELIKFLAIKNRLDMFVARNKSRIEYFKEILKVEAIYQETFDKKALQKLEESELENISEHSLNLNKNQSVPMPKYVAGKILYFKGQTLDLSIPENKEIILSVDADYLRQLISMFPKSVSTISADELVKVKFKQMLLKEIAFYVHSRLKDKDIREINADLGDLLSFRNEITNTFEGYVAGVQNMFNYIVKNYVKEKLPERFEEIDKKLKCNEDSSLIPEHRKKISVVVPVIEVDEKIEVETEIVEPEYEVKQEGTRKSMVSKELTEIYGGETSPKKEPEEKEDDGMVEGLSKEILELYGIDVAGDEE